MGGGPPARHAGGAPPRLYRLSPFRVEVGDLKRVHGTNERLAVENFANGIRFFRRLIENSGAAQPSVE